MENNKVRARLTPSRSQAPACDVALPGVPGEGSPEVPGAPEPSLPAAGRRGGQQLESSALATGAVPCSSFRDGKGHTPPKPPRGDTVTVTSGGRRGAGDGAPEGRSQPQPLGSCGGRGEPGGGRACRSAGRALAAGARGLPGALPRVSSRESRQPLRGTKPKSPRQKIRRQDPSWQSRSVPKVFHRGVLPLPRRSSAPGRAGAAAACGRGSEQGRAAGLLRGGRSGTSPGRGEGGVEP